MALSTTGYATATATGVSEHINLPPHPDGGDYVLHCSSAGAYSLDLQVGDGTTFSDAYYDGTNKVTLASTGVQTVRVAGGQCYRMDVDTYNSAITLRAREA